MKIFHKILVGLQIVLLIFGFMIMIMNVADTSKLSLPAQAYEERIFLSHILNAVQALVMFGAAIALDTLISKIRKDNDKS